MTEHDIAEALEKGKVIRNVNLESGLGNIQRTLEARKKRRSYHHDQLPGAEKNMKRLATEHAALKRMKPDRMPSAK